MMRALRCAAPAVLLVSLLLSPFLHKAFTIDDTLFLRQAEHLLSDPWHPTAFDIVWTEKPAPLRMSEIMVSGPTMAYLLVPTVMAGGAEWFAHLTQLALFALALVATASLALRCGLDQRAACIAATLLAATPAALAMASAAMPDIAAMTFTVLGFERLLAWRDSGRWPTGVVAAGSFALGALSRSHVLLLLPVAALLIPGQALVSKHWKQTSWKRWSPILAVPVLVWVGSLIVRDPLGPATVLDATLRYSGSGALGANVVAFAVHWSLVLPVAVPWMLVHWRRIVRKPAPYAATLAIALFIGDQQPPARLAAIAIAGGVGAAVLLDIVTDAWRRRDSLQFVFGLALFAPLPVGLYLQLPSKYLLVAAPMAAVIVARSVSQQAQSTIWRALAVTIPAGAVLGLLIVHTDAAFADLGRRAARELIAPAVERGRTVWFAGHWGFQWYAEKAGAQCLTLRGPAPRPGDLAVSSQMALGSIIDVFQPRALVSVIEDAGPGGRIMSKNGGAGFYSNAWGYLPWTWNDDPLDRYTLWRLDAVDTPSR